MVSAGDPENEQNSASVYSINSIEASLTGAWRIVVIR
jgi:hypothetical protein